MAKIQITSLAVNDVNSRLINTLLSLPKCSSLCISLPPLSTVGAGAAGLVLVRHNKVSVQLWQERRRWWWEEMKMDASQGNKPLLRAQWSLNVQWWDSPGWSLPTSSEWGTSTRFWQQMLGSYVCFWFTICFDNCDITAAIPDLHDCKNFNRSNVSVCRVFQVL